MDEVFPVVAGVVLGLITYRVSPLWMKTAMIGVLGVSIGALASWVSGELAVSWVYVLVDTGQVVLAAVMTALLVRAWLRRAARSPGRGDAGPA